MSKSNTTNENQIKDSRDIFWVDLARCIAIILVVTIHASADLFYEYGTVPFNHWLSANFYNSISRIGVPLFFLSSGFLLLGKQENLRLFFSRRILKIGIPFIFWSVFFIIWKSYIFQERLDFPQALKSILAVPAFPHLWFLYAILGLYITYPVLRPLMQNSSKSIQWYLALFWLVYLVLMPTMENYLDFKVNSDFELNIGIFTGFIGYPIFGYLMGKIPRYNRMLAAMIPVAFISPMATFVRTFLATETAGKINESFYHYQSPNVVFAAISSFYLIRILGNSFQNRFPSSIQAALASFSKTGFGIYLIHPIIIQLLAVGVFGIKISAFTGSPWITIPIVTILTVFISYIIVSTLRKLPFARVVIP